MIFFFFLMEQNVIWHPKKVIGFWLYVFPTILSYKHSNLTRHSIWWQSFIFKSSLRFCLINTQMRHDTPSDDRVSILERKKKQKQKTKNKKRRRRRIRWWRKACQYVEQLLLHSNYAVKICLSQWCEVPKYWTIWKSIW